jgi:uncharacterized repeat protein (TIGR03803 family)
MTFGGKILVFWCLLASAGLSHASSQTIPGQRPPVAASLKPLARCEPSKRLNLVIGLPLRNRPAFSALLHDLYDPASPGFHQYLTPAQFAERFGPTERDYQAVKDFAASHGLAVTGTHANRTLLDVSGTVADVEKALHVRMEVYQHPSEPRTFYAPDRAPSLDLAVPVIGIRGLDDFILPTPMNLKTAFGHGGADATAYVSGSGPSGYFLGYDFRAAYTPGVALTGAGQAVGLFELDGYYAADVIEYETLAKLPNVPLTNILLDGFSGTPGQGSIEVTLDIDMAICMAPGLSQVIVYEGANPDDVLNRMATDDLASQLSSSWRFGPQTDVLRDQIYQQFAAQGQSMFQASGDNGAYAGQVNPPQDDPNLTVVGGTLLTTSGAGGPWQSETAWPGSGGGSSETFAIPDWQKEVSMVANHGSTTFRNIPDVAGVAGIEIWLVAFQGEQGAIGGTSAATPLWAGFAALVNQQAAAHGLPPVGFLNPALYAIGEGAGYRSAFHDITSGNNTNSSSPSNYFAVAGYDLCTGWGTPKGSDLINALVSPPDSLLITPSTNWVASGPAGGPFTPASQNLQLTNIGLGPIHWALSAGAPWLNAAPPSGTLAPGGPATLVTLSLNSDANNLPPGTYAATIWFTNQHDQFAQSSQVTLNATGPPVITAQPASLTLPLGEKAVFSVGVSDNALLSYQWKFNSVDLFDGINVSGAATSALTIKSATSGDAGTYSVVVSNVDGVAYSDPATLVVNSSGPVILAQPAGQNVLPGASAVFTIAVAGNRPFFYQWQDGGTSLTDGGNISGSRTSALTIDNVTPGNAGSYSVIVSNSLNEVTSAVAVLSLVSVTAPGVVFSNLYSFTGNADGAIPNGLMQETNGDFYGTTQVGGAYDGGTFFQMTPTGVVTTLLGLGETEDDGFGCAAGLVQGTDGNLYGTTAGGGANGWGTVFKTTTNGSLSTVFTFDLGNGAFPAPRMVLGTDGNFYGTAYGGGGDQDGEVYKLTPAGLLNILFSFNYTDGYNPNALAQGADGALYGTTFNGGTGAGTLFKVATNGAFNNLLSFNYTNGGFLPTSGLTPTQGGNFYGTTYEGGAFGEGTLFITTPAGVVTTLYSFSGGNDGSHPSAELIQATDGNLYGTATDAGAYGLGTVFRFAPNGALTTLVAFDGYNGANPQAPLVQGADGNFYGTTQNGGASGNGVIFSISINSPSVQITGQPAGQSAFMGANALFSVAVAGNPPLFYQWQKNGSNLTDGLNISGSTTGFLTVSNVSDSDVANYSVMVSNAASSVTSDDAFLAVIESPPQIVIPPASQTLSVGETAVLTVGAVGDLPLTFQWQFNQTNLTNGGGVSGVTTSSLTISNLTQTSDGTYSVIVSNAIASASAAAVLTVYPVSIGGTVMTSLHWFTGGNDGGTPNGLALGSNGLLYGTTQTGGSFNDGTVFSITTNGVFTSLVSFDSTNGSDPQAAVVQALDGDLYGTTDGGGTNSAGTVFRMTLEGSLTSLYSFSNKSSVNPYTPLVQAADGDFYGATADADMPGDGNIFEMTSNEAPSVIYSFTGGQDGTTPIGALAQGNDGNFYGMTTGGGAYAHGGIFRMTPGGALTNIYYFKGLTDGYNPIGALVQGTDGYFYGVTRRNTISGLAFYGTIFKVSSNGVFTTLYALNPFVNGDGEYPFAGLMQATDGNFYGTTLFSSSAENGTLFRISPAGAFTTLAIFDGSDDGSQPEAALVQGPDGAFYGTTTAGGPYGKGSIFRLNVTSAPQITGEPASQTNTLGGNAIFSVAVFGASPLSYQWQFNGVNLTDGFGVSGSLSRILSLTNLTAASAGDYSVIVNNALGSVTSSNAVLAVVLPPAFQFAGQADGLLTLVWSALPGQQYQLQSTTNLGLPSWTNAGPALTASSTTLSVTNSIGSNSQQFYRIELLP